ncbi:MAG: helix-turn-helix transcriptional regulator [Rhodospirillaceae bacterium]|nr:helix-turn-helix transcriptional regulator [Rhodospirillaceae bacterium]MBT6203718.1 helix-turn-helix transcriptional regulator [Rhodospirillaceae bacterium]MBT7614271.1 helix-turn-helix transcriptional regulator [Rhodospirillaceae bacterium]
MSTATQITRQLSTDGAAVLGEAVASAGTTVGPEAIAGFVGEAVPNDVTAVFAWQAGHRPRHMHENYDERRKRVATQIYIKGAYLLDPFYVASQDIVSDCVLRLRDVQTDKFRQSEYYRSYYVATGLIDEISFYAKCENRSFLAVSIGRYHGAPKFSQRDYGRACFFLPVVAALVRRQWIGEVAPGPVGEHSAGNEEVIPLLQLLEQEPFSVLTVREREIVAMMLRGHSSKSIARAVAISVGTVKNHRKNIYRKLSVHSQSELFARFLDVIG